MCSLSWGKECIATVKFIERNSCGKKTMSPDLRRPMEDVWPIHMYYPHAWLSQGGLSEG